MRDWEWRRSEVRGKEEDKVKVEGGRSEERTIGMEGCTKGRQKVEMGVRVGRSFEFSACLLLSSKHNM